LRLIAAAFADARVAGVSGQMRVANALTSPAAYYAAIESLVNQFITMRSKDILRLGPALLGSNNTYRRSALQAVNGFRAGAFLEDSDLTVMLHRAGYITRYLPQAISYHHAPITLVGYIRQHLRWGRGFNDVTRTHLGAVLTDARLPWPMRIELGMFSLGYLDRLALLGVIALLFFNWLFALTFHVLLFTGISLSLGLPLLHILAVLHYDRAPLAMWLRLPLVPLFFALDAAVAVYSALASILNRPRQWHPTERA
jgi:cellulose synthase/poly-beta-1,6-N-acetylglucosamine synthase-like glycosyltransferase